MLAAAREGAVLGKAPGALVLLRQVLAATDHALVGVRRPRRTGSPLLGGFQDLRRCIICVHDDGDGHRSASRSNACES